MDREPDGEELRMLANMHPVVKAYGIASDLHAGEYVIRLYEGRTVREVCQDLKWTFRPGMCIIVRGLSGTQFYRESGNEFVPRPDIMTKVKTASAAAVGALSDLLTTGSPNAPDDVILSRRAICKAPCTYWDPANERCIKCECNMKLKTSLKSETCPGGFW